MGFRSRFRFDRGEELRSHHLHRALKHSLADACDRPADLNFSLVAHNRSAVVSRKIEFARALQKPRLAFPFHNHSKVNRRLKVFQANIAGKQTFD